MGIYIDISENIWLVEVLTRDFPWSEEGRGCWWEAELIIVTRNNPLLLFGWVTVEISFGSKTVLSLIINDWILESKCSLYAWPARKDQFVLFWEKQQSLSKAIASEDLLRCGGWGVGQRQPPWEGVLELGECRGVGWGLERWRVCDLRGSRKVCDLYSKYGTDRIKSAF